jgi:hypothetical protein
VWYVAVNAGATFRMGGDVCSIEWLMVVVDAARNVDVVQ